MHVTLLESLIDQVHKGKRSDNGFKSEAYTIVTDLVKAVSNQPELITKDKVKNRVHYLKDLYEVYKPLAELSGMGKDPETNILIADDDVWEAYIAAHVRLLVFVQM